MLLATFFVACFGYVSLAASTAHAATDAKWDGDNISYQNNTYAPAPADLTPPSDIQAGSTIYQYVDKSKTPNLVYFIYFSPTTENPKSAKEATYIRYTLNPPNSYINPTGKKTISLTPAEDTPDPKTEDGSLNSTCTIDGIGWMVCPLMNGISEGMDFIYERIQGFLSVQPITTSVDNPIYRIWAYSRDLANVAFIIGFMVIIYSYLVGGGFNGYEIRKILPRLVVAAVLINVSYIICAAAVDISNITGHGVNQLFENVRDNALPGSASTADLNWTSVTTWVLAGGSGAVAGALLIPGAVGGLGGLWLMLATFLFGAALVVMVTFLILAARQAIIIVLIAIAPLAFAAYILPNTEKWFEKWRSLFFTMLVMFPAFGAVFGGAQLAGEVIIRTATGIEQIILGLGVMVAPLAITPLLLKLGGGVLNRIGGIINNRQKGLYDRVKNHNEDRRQQLVARHQALNAERRANGDFGGRRFNPRTMVRRRAATNYARRNYRDEQKKQDEEAAQNYWHRQTGRWGYDSHFEHDNFAERNNARNRFGIRQDGFGNLDTYKRRNAGLHDLTEGEHEEHWQNRLNSPAGAADRAMLTDTRMAQGRAKVISGAFEAQDERALQTALNTDRTYANLRNMKVQTSVDSGIAETHSKQVEAEGQEAFRRAIEGSRALSRVVKDTHHANKQAEIYEKIVQKAAEKSWNDRIRNDDATQTSYLKSVRYEDGATIAEKRLEEFTQEIRARGDTTRGLTATNQAIANVIQANSTEIAARDSAISNLKDEQSVFVLKQLSSDQAIRNVAGAGSQLGATKVLAKAQSGITKQYLEDVKAQTSVYSNDGYRVDEMLGAMQDPNYKLHDGTVTDTIAQHAAVQHVMESIGNNWSVQKIIEWADTQGMELVEGQNGQPDKYYDGVAYRDAIRTGSPLPQALSAEEVADRRDLLQMVVGGYRNGKNKVSYFTNTLQERVNRGLSISSYNADLGRDLTFAEAAILTEARQQKYDPNRITNMDPDELARMAQLLRNPNFRKQMTDQQRTSIISSIVQAQSSDQTRHLIKDRERGLMNIVASYLELPPDTNPPIDELRDIEQNYSYVEREDDNGVKYSVRVPRGTPGALQTKVSVEVPNVYSYKRQVDQVSGTGLMPDRNGHFDINDVIK